MQLETTLKKHFNRTMLSIQEGLPEVVGDEEAGEAGDADYTFAGTHVGTWTCRTCTLPNQMEKERCEYCETPKRSLKLKMNKKKK